MVKLVSWSAVLLALLTFVACGPPPSPVTPGTPTANLSENGDRALVVGDDGGEASDYDVSPVPEPGEIVAIARWHNPQATATQLASYAKLPPEAVDEGIRTALSALVAGELDEIVDPEVYAEIIAIETPVDFVLVADIQQTPPEPMGVVAVGLTSLDRARAGATSGIQEISTGVWRLAPEREWGPHCAIAASSGATQARLICGDEHEHVAALASYVARTAPMWPRSSTDLHAELRLRGLADKYGDKLRRQANGLPVLFEEFKLGNPVFDTALMDMAAGLAEEAGKLIHDVDKMSLDIGFDLSRGIQVSGELEFAGKRSWTVQLLMDGADKAGPAPEIFWRAPKSSEVVSYGRTADPRRFDTILRVLQQLAEGGLEEARFARPGDRRALAKLLRLPVGKHVATVGASGHFDAATTASGQEIEQFVSDIVGWQLYGFDEDSRALRRYLDELVAVYNRPSLQAAIRKDLSREEAKLLPKVKKVAAPAALGRGALDVQIQVANIPAEVAVELELVPAGSAPRARTLTVSVHLLLMADGRRSWLGLATGKDREALAQLMAATKGASPGPDSIAGQPGLREFKTGRHSSGGMTTLRGVIASAKSGVLGAVREEGGPGLEREVERILGSLPNRGTSPLVFYSDVVDGRAPKTSFEITIPKAALEDIGYIVEQALGLAQR